MEERLTKSIQQRVQPQTSTNVEFQAREHALQEMAKELDAKFVFVMGSAAKAKKLPHMSTIRNKKGTATPSEEQNVSSNPWIFWTYSRPLVSNLKTSETK